MADMSLMLVFILGFIVFMMVYSQQKFKTKLLCAFIRANRQRVEQWVPLHSTYVEFKTKYGMEHYEIDPSCIQLMWYDRGFNKINPVLVPYVEFKWDTPRPLDPKTFKSTWLTPKTRAAAWSEQSHIAFAKGTSEQVGKKSRFPEWFFPAIILGVVLMVAFLVYQLGARMDYLEHLIQVGQ